MDRLNVELGPYYRLAINMDADAILSGSSTGLAVEEPIPEEIQEDVAPEIDPGDERPLFVVPDSKGSIRICIGCVNSPIGGMWQSYFPIPLRTIIGIA